MAIRLVITHTAGAGRGAELLAALRDRTDAASKEPGCEQFELFQSSRDPDKIVLLELWKDQAALDVHAKRPASGTPLPEGLRIGVSAREDYEYNRVR